MTGLNGQAKCPNPYCKDGLVRCEGGIAKGVYMIYCRLCKGKGSCDG